MDNIFTLRKIGPSCLDKLDSQFWMEETKNLKNKEYIINTPPSTLSKTKASLQKGNASSVPISCPGPRKPEKIEKFACEVKRI